MGVLEKKKLGELLCELCQLDHEQLSQALREQEGRRCPLGRVLLELGYISEQQLNEALAVQAGIKAAELSEVSIDAGVIGLVPAELVSRHNVMPLWRRDGELGVAMANPLDRRAIRDLQTVTGLRVQRFYAGPDDLERAVLKFYGSNVARMLDDLTPTDGIARGEYSNGDVDYSPAKLHELAKEPSLVNLVNLILFEAIEARASDVHIEPFERQLKIKYRIDGMLVEKSPAPKRLQAAIISRIKIMANMNIAERFVPQDGHFEFAGHNGRIDVRVSTVPSLFGESVTMRVLDRSASLIDLEQLGMSKQVLEGFNQCLGKAHGIVLVTGPTGSGKTTTLYAALNKIYSPSLKIITIEDPVEYQLDGIVQMPVNPKRGLTFATGLRHIVRQDPDIIMVGEIRDRETADIAIRAALTGHLVFSTLHTNNAAGAVTRLIDMGVEPFLLASSLEAVLAQRLVRTICKRCKESYVPDASLLRSLRNSIDLEGRQLYRGAGCEDCLQSGMMGRLGIFELLRVNEPLRQLIAGRPTNDQIDKAAPPGHESMRHDGIVKMVAGMTTPEEVLRVTQAIEDEMYPR